MKKKEKNKKMKKIKAKVYIRDDILHKNLKYK